LVPRAAPKPHSARHGLGSKTVEEELTEGTEVLRYLCYLLFFAFGCGYVALYYTAFDSGFFGEILPLSDKSPCVVSNHQSPNSFITYAVETEIKTIITAVGLKTAGPEKYRFTLAGSATINKPVEWLCKTKKEIIMSVRHVIKCSLSRCVLPILLVCSLAMPGNRAHGQDMDGPEIAPRGFAEAPAANLRTPEQMTQAESAALSVTKQQLGVPFLPTISRDEYDAAKNAAIPGSALAQPGAFAASLGAAQILLNGPGISQTAAGGVFPPDTHGAVGATQFVEVVNSRVVVYSKNFLSPPLKSTSLSAFFGTSEFVFRARVVYDGDWQRWIIVATRLSTSSTDTVRRFFLAVSKTSDATGAYFTTPVFFNGSDFQNGNWWDYPELGIDQDAVLITGNIINSPVAPFTFRFAALMPIAKARIYNGLPFNVPVFANLMGTLAPPIVRDQNASTFLIAAPPNSNALKKYTLLNSSRVPGVALFGPVDIPVPAYSIPPNASQFGTTKQLATLDSRFVNASTQIGDELWQVHTIAMNGRPSPKFYQVNTATNTVTSSGFFFASPTSNDWNASIAVNDRNQAVATWSSTDASARINAQVRVASGPAGTGTALFTSPTFYSPTTSTVQPWGDYSAITIDPVRPNDAWLVNETNDSASVWGSQIGHVTFP
jgi:hypothetical protein